MSEDSAVENIEVFVLKRFGNRVLCFVLCCFWWTDRGLCDWMRLRRGREWN